MPTGNPTFRPRTPEEEKRIAESIEASKAKKAKIDNAAHQILNAKMMALLEKNPNATLADLRKELFAQQEATQQALVFTHSPAIKHTVGNTFDTPLAESLKGYQDGFSKGIDFSDDGRYGHVGLPFTKGQ